MNLLCVKTTEGGPLKRPYSVITMNLRLLPLSAWKKLNLGRQAGRRHQEKTTASSPRTKQISF